MSAILADFERVFVKLFKLQQADPPAIVWEGVAKVLRFGLLALLLLAALLLIQAIISACGKQWKKSVFLALSCIAVAVVPAWALAKPIPVAPSANVLSVTVQTPVKDTDGVLIWGNDRELSAQKSAAVAKTLATQQCRRTLRQTLPPIAKGMHNVVITLEGGKRYQILIVEGSAYRYETQATGFLCAVQQYDTFYSALSTGLNL